MRFVNAPSIGVRPVLWEHNDLLLIHRPQHGNHRTFGYGSLSDEEATRIHEGLLRLGFSDLEAQTYWVNTDGCEDVAVDPDASLAQTYGQGVLNHNVTVRQFADVMEHINDEVQVGTRVRHHDFTDPVTVVLVDAPGAGGYHMVHAPEGSRASGARGWRLSNGANLGVDAQEQVRANMARLGIEWVRDSDSDGFWLVRPDAITVVTSTPQTDPQTDPETDIEVFTMREGWDVCRGSESQRHHEHVLIPSDDGWTWTVCGHVERHESPADNQLVRKNMAKLGIDPLTKTYLQVSRTSVDSRRHLRKSEVAEFLTKFRPSLPNSGWGTYTVAVVEDGSIVWRPACFVTDREVHVLYRSDDAHGETTGINRFGNHRSYVERFGLPVDDSAYRVVPASEVVGFLPHMQMSLIIERIADSGVKADAMRALAEFSEERSRFVEVITAGGRRLGLDEEDVTKFIEEADLGPLRKYEIQAQVQVTGTVTMTQEVNAVDEASAMRMWRHPERGEATITIPRSDTVHIEGTPIVRQR